MEKNIAAPPHLRGDVLFFFDGGENVEIKEIVARLQREGRESYRDWRCHEVIDPHCVSKPFQSMDRAMKFIEEERFVVHPAYRPALIMLKEVVQTAIFHATYELMVAYAVERYEWDKQRVRMGEFQNNKRLEHFHQRLSMSFAGHEIKVTMELLSRDDWFHKSRLAQRVTQLFADIDRQMRRMPKTTISPKEDAF